MQKEETRTLPLGSYSWVRTQNGKDLNVRSETIKLVEENKLICSLTLALAIPFWICLFRLVNQDPSSQGYDFSSGHVWM